jgi:hypothetical protein
LVENSRDENSRERKFAQTSRDWNRGNGRGSTKGMIGTDKAEVSAEEKTLELFVSRCMADAVSISLGNVGSFWKWPKIREHSGPVGD